MPLINCKDCSKPISTSAPTCIGCGAKNPNYINKEQLIQAFLAIFAVLAIVVWFNWPSEKVEPEVISSEVAAVPTPEELAASEEHGKFKQKMLKHFTSSEEPSVKDATWTDDTIFKIGRFYKGSNQNGYADYACTIMRENGLKKQVWIQIIDIQKLVDTEEFVKIGETHCALGPATVVDFIN